MIRFVVICLLASLFYISCQFDGSISSEDLAGSWEVVDAKRNGKNTKTLDGALFEFSEEGIMKTNILGEMAECDFELDDHLILQLGADGITYSIAEMTDSTLALLVRLKEVPFEFSLQRISGE